MVVDDEEKANILNTFFSTVFTAENEMLGEIPRNNENPILRVTNLTQEEVRNRLNKIKIDKSPGPDGIHPRVLRELSNVIDKPLFLIFRDSIATGSVPQDWRIANVVPIFKKGSKSEPGNYRPRRCSDTDNDPDRCSVAVWSLESCHTDSSPATNDAGNQGKHRTVQEECRAQRWRPDSGRLWTYPFSAFYVCPAYQYELIMSCWKLWEADLPSTPLVSIKSLLQDHIGWRNVTRLLVFASDDVFHMAGDGKLAGIYIPADGRCHLNENGEYHHSNMFDYPSVGHLSQILTAANIQPIFAVTSNVLPTYQGLSELIPKSAVGELKEDSSNVVNLISQAYNNLSSTVNLEHVNLPKGIHISYSSNCPDATKKEQPYGLCSGVKINQMVDFNVTLWMDEKICQDGVQSFKLRVLGFNEEINVDIEPVCHCDCQDGEAFSDYCTGGSGNYSCGICR
ncbi:unnamed protein product [Ranitomeya imitator]|uniref:Integrin beta n=1 Tax=Ranitomeya imitator TaxID=111125 RepID=A0ABN9LGH7_9NEOB|nr:unnamed protein product [Ranitomeya imitator]